MQLYYIRHSQSANNVRWDKHESSEGREPDPELTALGRKQLNYLVDYVQNGDPRINARESQQLRGEGLGITHVYCSLMLRAVETGVAISRALGIPLVAWPDLHERGGLWHDEDEGQRTGVAGPGKSYFMENYPELVLPESMDEIGWWNRPPESWSDVPQRAERLLTDLLERHSPDDRVAWVAHGGLYNSLLRVLLNMETNEGYWFELNNAAVSRIDFRDGHTALMFFNRIAHLPPALLT